MFEDQSGWLWLLINVIAVVILAAAIIYGTMHWRKHRSRALNQARDNATDRLYHKQ
jgi:flagellar basal body-associated protein FliL